MPSATQETSTPLRLYFAGPLFTHGEWHWNELLARELGKLGFSVFLPQSFAEPMLAGRQPFDGSALFNKNVAELDACDAVVAVLDQADADSGTCWECGFAYSRGKTVIGVRTDLRGSGEESGVNLMLSRSCKKLIVVRPENRTDVALVAQEVSAALSGANGP